MNDRSRTLADDSLVMLESLLKEISNDLDLSLDNYPLPPKVLSGWSPGDIEIPMPDSKFRPVTPKQQALCDNFKPWETWREVPVERQFSEFPLYGRKQTRDPKRAYNQELSISNSLKDGVSLVLATSDYTVYRSNSILGLLWVYVKHKVAKIWTKLRNRRMVTPSYTKAKCHQTRKPKSERTLFSQRK